MQEKESFDMLLLDFIAAFVVAMLFSLLLVSVFGWKRPDREGFGSAVIYLFFLLVLIVWAGGVWVGPMGPAWWGIAWIPFLAFGFVGSLLIAALVPPRRRPRNTREAIEQTKAQVGAEATLTAFFWMLLVILIIAIITRYML